MAEKVIFGANASTWIKILNVILGCLMIFYSFFTMFTVVFDVFDASPILIVSFRVYEILFGVLIVMSFCNWSFITNQFKFLRTVSGKGYFNLFIASMFLVASDGIWGYLMCGLFAAFGIFFILVGCACLTGYDDLHKD